MKNLITVAFAVLFLFGLLLIGLDLNMMEEIEK